MVDSSSTSSSLSSFPRFRLSRTLALGFVALPALVFLGLGAIAITSSTRAGVEGLEAFFSFIFGLPPGVTRGVSGAGAGVLIEGVLEKPPPMLNFNLRPLMIANIRCASMCVLLKFASTFMSYIRRAVKMLWLRWIAVGRLL